MNTTLNTQLEMFREQTEEVKENVRQAGSSQEKFISEASSLRQEQGKELTAALDKITKRVYKFTAAVFLTSVLLSGLVSVLCLHWLS
jgi:F0F1-type ATP synthase delta subunit